MQMMICFIASRCNNSPFLLPLMHIDTHCPVNPHRATIAALCLGSFSAAVYSIKSFLKAKPHCLFCRFVLLARQKILFTIGNSSKKNGPNQMLRIKSRRLFSLEILKCFYSSCCWVLFCRQPPPSKTNVCFLPHVRKQTPRCQFCRNCVLMEEERSCSRFFL